MVGLTLLYFDMINILVADTSKEETDGVKIEAENEPIAVTDQTVFTNTPKASPSHKSSVSA